MKQNIISTILCLPIMVACSSTSNDQNAVEEQASSGSTSLVAGSSCNETLDALVDSDITYDPSLNNFNCDDTPITNLSTEGVVSTGDGLMSIGTVVKSISGAFGDFVDQSTFTNHRVLQLYIHDGELRLLERSASQDDGVINRLDWGVYKGSIALSVQLASAGTEEFGSGVYEFASTEDIEDPTLIGSDVILFGTVFHDSNENETIDSAQEIAFVTSGNIVATKNISQWMISYDLSLSSGETLTGEFNGGIFTLPGGY